MEIDFYLFNMDKTSQNLLYLYILYDFKLVKVHFYFDNFNKFNTFLNNLLCSLKYFNVLNTI